DACSRFVQRIGGDDDISELLRHNQEVLGDSGVAGVAGAGGVAFPPRILNMTVPQVGHFPLMALRPFFITSSTASTISFLALHLTQYPSGIKNFLLRHSMRQSSNATSLGAAVRQRQQVK